MVVTIQQNNRIGRRGMLVVQIIRLRTMSKRRLVAFDAGEDSGVLTPRVQRLGGKQMVQGGRRARDWGQCPESVEVKPVSQVETNISLVSSRGTSAPCPHRGSVLSGVQKSRFSLEGMKNTVKSMRICLYLKS
jgi:hypothetical protein